MYSKNIGLNFPAVQWDEEPWHIRDKKTGKILGELPCLKIRHIARDVFLNPPSEIETQVNAQIETLSKTGLDVNNPDVWQWELGLENFLGELRKIMDPVTAEFVLSSLIIGNDLDLRTILAALAKMKTVSQRVWDELQLSEVEEIYFAVEIILLTMESLNGRPPVVENPEAKSNDDRFMPSPKYEFEIFSWHTYLSRVAAGDWQHSTMLGNCTPLSMAAYYGLSVLGFKVDMYRIGTIDEDGKEVDHAYISVNGKDKEPTRAIGHELGSLIFEQRYNIECSPIGLAIEIMSGLAKARANKIRKEFLDEAKNIKNTAPKMEDKEQYNNYLLEKRSLLLKRNEILEILLKDIKSLEASLKYASRNLTVLDNIAYVYKSLMDTYNGGAGAIEQALWACDMAMTYIEKEIEVLDQNKAKAENKTTELKAAAIKSLDEKIKSLRNVVARYWGEYIEIAEK